MSTAPASRIVLIANRRSGRYNSALISELSNAIRNSPSSVEVLISDGEGDSTAGAVHQAARNGATAVIIIGGDGTISHAIGAIAKTGLALGIYPAGTVNLLARELGLPLKASPGWWADLFCRGGVGDLFLGRANFSDGHSQLFHSIASAGPDAAAAARVNLLLKKVIGRAAYILPALADLASEGVPMQIECDGENMCSKWALVARGRFYAGGYRLRSAPIHGHQTFAVSLIKPRVSSFTGAAEIFRNRLEGSVRWHHLDVGNVRILEPSGVPVQLDGDIAGATPVDLSVVSKPIRVICNSAPKTSP